MIMEYTINYFIFKYLLNKELKKKNLSAFFFSKFNVIHVKIINFYK